MAKDTETSSVAPPSSPAPVAKPAAAAAVPPVTAVRNAGDASPPPDAAPDPSLPTFVVTHNGQESTVQAVDDREAWRLVCDSKKSWPNPKTGKVHRNGKQVYPPIK